MLAREAGDRIRLTCDAGGPSRLTCDDGGLSTLICDAGVKHAPPACAYVMQFVPRFSVEMLVFSSNY
jgi:hypothetical protein